MGNLWQQLSVTDVSLGNFEQPLITWLGPYIAMSSDLVNIASSKNRGLKIVVVAFVYLWVALNCIDLLPTWGRKETTLILIVLLTDRPVLIGMLSLIMCHKYFCGGQGVVDIPYHVDIWEGSFLDRLQYVVPDSKFMSQFRRWYKFDQAWPRLTKFGRVWSSCPTYYCCNWLLYFIVASYSDWVALVLLF